MAQQKDPNDPTFTEELMAKLLEEINIDTERIVWHGFTGGWGHRWYTAIFELEITKQLGLLSDEEYKTLEAMINSPDRENMTVAEEIIKQKRKK